MGASDSSNPNSDLAAILRQTILFESLDEAHVTELLRFSRRRSYDAGQTIFLQGDRANGLFIVLSGRVRVFKTSPRGREQILKFMRQGEPIGEVAVLSGENYPAGAEAVEPSETLYIPRKAFLDLIEREPEVAMRLLGELSSRLKSFASLIEDLSLRDVAQRLAAQLLALASEAEMQEEVDLSISKAQLSAAVGTVPETLSRAFKQLNQAGAVETHGRKVRIKNRQLLRQLADKSQDPY